PNYLRAHYPAEPVRVNLEPASVLNAQRSRATSSIMPVRKSQPPTRPATQSMVSRAPLSSRSLRAAYDSASWRCRTRCPTRRAIGGRTKITLYTPSSGAHTRIGSPASEMRAIAAKYGMAVGSSMAVTLMPSITSAAYELADGRRATTGDDSRLVEAVRL